jgi:hypothetical protein
LVYLLFRRVLEVVALRLRSREFKELEIVGRRVRRRVGRERRAPPFALLVAAHRERERVEAEAVITRGRRPVPGEPGPGVEVLTRLSGERN